MLRFWHDFGFTILMSYFMYILFEAPFAGLEMLLLPNRRPSPKPAATSVDPKIANIQVEPAIMESAPVIEQKTVPIS